MKLNLIITIAVLSACLIPITGCRSPAGHLEKADKEANRLIEKYQQEALGRTETFSVVRPSDTLRQRLMIEQDLPGGTNETESVTISAEKLPDPLVLSLVDALQIGARNSREYQSAKEAVFTTALDLDLSRAEFRNSYSSLLSSLFTGDNTGDETEEKVENSFSLGVAKKFKTGATLSAKLGLDLVKLLTMDKSSTFGISADATVIIPLLKGAGRDIAREPLTQAERNLIYAIWNFELFKESFVIQIVDEYLSILEQAKQIQNAEENYRNISAARQRIQSLAEAGRVPETQVNQAMQDELTASNRVIAAKQAFEQRLDTFKQTLGLPVDARIRLDEEQMNEIVDKTISKIEEGTIIDLSSAINTALENRLDLKIACDKMEDSARKANLARDALKTGMDLKVSGSTRETDTRGGSGEEETVEMEFGKGNYSAGLDIDIPLDKTDERNAYRKSIIAVEESIRAMEAKEDDVKKDVRDGFRRLQEAKETFTIQSQAVKLAERRVKSTELFVQAGRTEIRDLLEAQESLVSARNALVSAIVSYHSTWLSLKKNTGTLQLTEEGIWREDN